MNKEQLEQKMIIVRMNDADISTEEKPIIGTYALATCLGVLLYSEEKRKAIVAHISASDPIPTLDKVFNIMIKNKLLNTPIKYKIILGYDKEAYQFYKTEDILKEYFKYYIPFSEEEFSPEAIKTEHELGANAFAFNAETGKFITDDILLEIGNNKSNSIKHR